MANSAEDGKEKSIKSRIKKINAEFAAAEAAYIKALNKQRESLKKIREDCQHKWQKEIMRGSNGLGDFKYKECSICGTQHIVRCR